MRKELSEIFLLYAPDGLVQWEALQKEIARQRKAHKDALKKQQQEKRKRLNILMWIGASIIVIAFAIIEFYILLY